MEMNPPYRELFDDDFNEARRALESLPPEQRLHTAVIADITSEGQKTAKLGDVYSLSSRQRQRLVQTTFQTSDQDNGHLLLHMKERLDKARVPLPTVEVRFEKLSVNAEIYVGSRALPSLINFVRNLFEEFLVSLKILPRNKRGFPILNGVSGVVKPGRMMLLLGPPGSGKSTLLKALSGKLEKDLTVSF